MRNDPRHRQRPTTSWPAALLPGALLVALFAGASAQTSSSDERPVIDMTVTGTLGR